MKKNLVSAVMMAAMSLGSTGCFLFEGTEQSTWDADVEVEFEIASPTEDDVVVSPTTVRLDLEKLGPSEAGNDYYDMWCDLYVDGEQDDSAPAVAVYFDYAEDTWVGGEVPWNPIELEAGDYDLTVSCSGFEETVTVTVGDALVVASVSGPSDDGGSLGGAPEFEVHLYDADGGAWLGCSAGSLTVLRDGAGVPILPGDVDGMNLTAMVIENDGNGCPEQPTIGDVGVLTDDDDYVSEVSFTVGDLKAGVQNGDVTLTLGRGY